MKLKSTLLAFAATLALAAHANEFRSADIHNADDYPTVVAVKHMSTVLEKLSGGKHKIKVFNKGALGSEKETIDQVKIGALDMVRVNVAPMNGVPHDHGPHHALLVPLCGSHAQVVGRSGRRGNSQELRVCWLHWIGFL